MLAGLAHAASPQGGQIVSGSGRIEQAGNVTTITQGSSVLSLNWQSFNLSAGQTVDFLQPGRNAIAINRILGNEPSEIYGSLHANGQVWLINPNGVLFGKGAQVNVGGLVASTLDPDDSALGTGSVRFSGNGRGKVVNQGHITAAPGGYVALLGNQVSNQGLIRAQLGTVALGGGTAMTLTFRDSRLMHLVVDESTVQSLVENQEMIVADGGNVLMTAGARASLIDSVVNNTGTVQAQTVAEHNGTITLLAGMEAGTVQVGGVLDASAPVGGDGGAIETSGAHFDMAAGTRITAASTYGKGGTWLVDPVDLTIDGAAAATISDALNGGTNVTEQTTATGSSGAGNVTAGNGDINVNAAIDWSSTATLTLDAYRNINVNATISGANGRAVLNTGVGNSSDAGTLTVSGGGSVSAGLGAIINAGAFVNGSSASALGASWMVYTASPSLNTLGGIVPDYIQYGATQGSPLAASGNGLIYSAAPTLTISGLTGTVSKVYDTTAAASFVGSNFNATGLLGGDVISSATGGTYASVNVANGINVTSPGAISNYVITNGGVPVYGYILGGAPFTASVGSITPYPLVLVGTRAYNGGLTMGPNDFAPNGILAGLNGQTLKLSGVGRVADRHVGTNKPITNLFTLALSDGSNGGLAGNYTLIGGFLTITPKVITVLATANNKIYDTTNAAVASIAAPGIAPGDVVTFGAGLATFADANAGIGKTVTVNGITMAGTDAGDYTLASSVITTSANILPYVLGLNGSRAYDGSSNANASSFGTNGVLVGLNGQTVRLSGAGHVGDKNIGTDKVFVDLGTLVLSDGSNGGLGGNYTLMGGTDVLTITPKAISVIATVNDKTYDTTNAATVASLEGDGAVAGDALTYGSGSATFADANAANGKTVTVVGLTLGGADVGNYTLASTTTTTTANIMPYVLSLSSTRVYDGSVGADASLFGVNGVLTGLNGQTVNLNGLGQVIDKNVGSNKAFGSLGTLALSDGSNGGVGSNYTLIGGTDVLTITPRAISVVAAVNDKMYDTTNVATVASLTGDGAAAGDALTYDSGSATFADANAANGKTVTVDGLTLSGADAGNYTLASTTTTTMANITPYVLSVSGSRVYDGKLDADASLFGTNGVLLGLNGQTVNLSGSGQVTDKNVGSNKAFGSLGTLTLSDGSNGGMASNYTLIGGENVLTITPKEIVVDATGVNKMFDGTTRDKVLLGSPDILAGDHVEIDYLAANFLDPNIANDKPVTVTGLQLRGADAGNYALTNTSAMTEANITGARPSAFGIQDGLLASLFSLTGPVALGTPYGLAAQDATGPYTGNKRKQRQMVERIVSRDDLISGLSLKVIDGGVRVPAQALP